jgi:hypothetical protein
MSGADEGDRLLRLLVSQRGTCERCHLTRGTETAHIIRRRYQATRFLEEGAWWLCSGPGTNDCHYLVDHFAGEHEQLVAETIGADALADLTALAQAGPTMPLSMWHRNETARLRDRCRALGISTRGQAA